MAGVAGRSGTNKGQEKAFSEAVRMACYAEDRKKLRAIANKLVECAENGESWAVQQVADRLDGKPAQAVEHSGPDGGAMEFESSDTRALARAVLALFREANLDSTS